ncbi:MAG: NHL repeat-containing protein, partial [Bdellovibrionota bacterium]
MRSVCALVTLSLLLGCGAPVDPNVPSPLAPVESFALGQASLTSTSASTTASGLSSPRGMGTDGTRFLTADTGNNRVLLWTALPASTGAAANFALGQASLTTAVLAAPLATTLSGPQGASINGTNVYVADSANNRVLIWTAIPAANAAPANNVIGQAAMNANAPSGASLAKMNNPTSVYCDGTNTIVADTGNNRVLIWNSTAPATNSAANFVVGQNAVNGTTANFGGLSAKSLKGPKSVFSDGTHLIVADTGNNRVLIWNSIPSANFQAADVVLGQPDFVTNSVAAPSASSLNSPSDIIHISTTSGNSTIIRLYVADTGFHRILGWTSIPNTNAMGAAAIYGQSNMSSAFTNDVNTPVGVSITGSGSTINLMIADSANNRILA